MMIKWNRLFKLESKQFARNRLTWLGFSIFIVIGLYAIWHGKATIDKQREIIAQVDMAQSEQLETHLTHHADHEIGALLYYQFFYTKNLPTDWAGFSIGQRDINPYTLKVRMLAVEGQLYDTELTNPITLLSGNLDISFVFIFLLPLLVIALTFNVLSAEQESGVWAFVASQPVALHKVLYLKLCVKFIALSLVIATLFVAAVIIHKLPVDMRLFVVVALVLAYLIFWFMVVFFVITLKNSSNINAVTLLSSWLFLLVLIPSLSNVIIIRLFPIPEALATTVTQREAYHEKWDMPKSVVMEPFFASYPQYSHYSIPEDRFSYGWYYAMMFAADSEATRSASELFDKLEKRQRASQWIGYFIPNLFLQNTFNKIAKTDLENHVAYLKSVKAFHRRLSEFFYPSIFEMDLPHTINWDELPEFQLITTE